MVFRLRQTLKSPARILRLKQPFHSSPFSLFPLPQGGKIDFQGNRTTLVAMIMSVSVFVWIWYQSIIASIPAWLWSVIVSISGILFGVSLSIKDVRRWIRILAIVITLAVLLSSAFSLYHLTETKEQKRLKETIENLRGTIKFQRDQLKRKTILADTRVKVGENPHFISGDFVDDRPLIEVLPHRRPTEISHPLIKDISLTNTDEGVTIHSKKFDCQLSTALPKENLSAGHYVAKLTVTPSILWRTESGEFEKIEGESEDYQTEFTVAEEFDIKHFSVWMAPTEKRLFWGLPGSETTVTYILTKSASSVEILVRDSAGKLVRSTERVYDPTTTKFIPESPPPGHAGYNEYPLSEFPLWFLFSSSPHMFFQLRVKKDEKEISKTTLYLPVLNLSLPNSLEKENRDS